LLIEPSPGLRLLPGIGDSSLDELVKDEPVNADR
jgi:hypothetical protein